ncbi:MAG TPA: nicotinate (nicotinamide) nucleotide adenylyltransferase [Coleofasciculaceae cyanobacterium]
MGRKAIFGGTFDPIHWGHLLIAETALSQIALEQVIWVPARRPPHKQVLSYEHRRAIVDYAIADNPAFILDAPPISNVEPDYAINTLAHFQHAYPNQDWYWIIGLDAFQTLPRWYARDRLIPNCNWLVAPRPLTIASQTLTVPEPEKTQKAIYSQMSQLCQHVAQQLTSENISIHWQLLQMPVVGISSSLIRQYCRQHRSIRYLVPETVQAYIAIHQLYLD